MRKTFEEMSYDMMVFHQLLRFYRFTFTLFRITYHHYLAFGKQ